MKSAHFDQLIILLGPLIASMPANGCGSKECVHQPAMLFNLKDDIGEKTNLAQIQPQKLRELQAAFAE